MISAPSRLLRSNGNNSLWLLSLLIFSFSLASCDLFKKLPENPNRPPVEEELGEIQPPIKVDPVTGEVMPVTVLVEKMDTVKWKELSTDR